MEVQEKSQLFPTTGSFLVFWSYIGLFVSQGLLVTAVQRSQIEGFNAVIVVLLVELTKLAICLIIYLLRSPYEGAVKGAIKDLYHDIRTNKRLLLLYLVPAFLYCLYNNLTFINLTLFDVSTYYCLMQFRIVLTALIYQLLFRRRLTLIQWASLLILTLGCLVKEYGMYSSPQHLAHNSTSNKTRETPFVENTTKSYETSEPKELLTSLWSIGLLTIQMFCSCFAGVYNEYLLKEATSSRQTDIILQNIFLYIDSILCNLVALKLTATYMGSSNILSTNLSLQRVLYNLLTSPLVLLLILNNALSGLVASFFLKSLNSILKTFASALELFAVTFLAWLLFNNKVDASTVVALILVSVATTLYSSNPVNVGPPDGTPKINNTQGFVLLRMNNPGRR